MSVEISPSGQLGFTRPLTRLVTQTIKIHNPNSAPVAFKVKTTAPKQYCVRPNSGRVESGESVEVQVLLQPLENEPPPHAKCKDKFLVQSAYISPDEEMHTLAEMWAQTERNNKAAIHEQKIKSVYLAAEDGSHANGIREEDEGELGESRVMDESGLDYQAFKTPTTPKKQADFQDGRSKWTVEQDKEYDSRLFRNGGHSYWETTQLPYVPPAPKDLGKLDGKSGAIFTHAQTSPSGHNANFSQSPAAGGDLAPPLPSTAQQTPNAAPAPRDAPAAATGAAGTTGLPELSSSAVGNTNSALERSLSATTSDAEKVRVLMAEVERLQAQASNGGNGADQDSGPQVTGLRRRGGGSVAQQAGEKAEVAVEKAKEAVQTGQGVPLEVVVGLVVAVFMMTYLFF